MPESPSPPKDSQDSDPQSPNKPTSDSDDPSKIQQPTTPEPDNPKELPNPDHNQLQKPEEHQILVDGQQQEDPEQLEPEGMSLSLSYSSHEETTIKGSHPPAAPSARRGPKRKKGHGKSHKSQAALEKKLQTLTQNFKAIPFVPGKVLNFSKHEGLLKKLGLWEFSQLEFDKNLRVDFILELIANYAPKARTCYVNGCRIGVSRADLGRALKLPVKKVVGAGAGAGAWVECDRERYPTEFRSFLREFVSNWMLLHEDLWFTPNEVVNWMNLIEKGDLEKVDWAGLIWFMVEKELAKGVNLTNCHYASHLHQLIKSQKEDMFRDNHVTGESVAEEEEEAEDGSDVKMLDYEEFSLGGGQKSEEQNVELKLGQECVLQVENVGGADNVEMVEGTYNEEDVGGSGDKVEKVEEGVDKVEEIEDTRNVESVNEVQKVDNTTESTEHFENFDNIENAFKEEESKDEEMMDFGDCKEEEQGQWLFDGKNDGGHHFMQRCSMTDLKVSMEENRGADGAGEGIDDEGVEEDGHVEGFKIMQKGPLEGMSSANLMQAFETGQLPYTSADLGGQSSLQLMSSRVDNNVVVGGPSMFNQAGKREIGHEQDVSHHGLNDNLKRVRLDGPWDHKPRLDGPWDHKPPDFDTCIEQILQWVEKAKMAHEAAKEGAFQQANMTQQIFAHEMAEKDNEILQLRCKVDELQRLRHGEINRLDKELYLMNSVIDGYRRALKETQKTFAEYRKRRCSVPDEPIYKDAGSGGVVKSIMELEKEKMKQEEEKRLLCYLLEEAYKKQMDDYEVKWVEFLTKVESHDSRLLNAAKEVELLKEQHAVKHKTSDSVDNEPQVQV